MAESILLAPAEQALVDVKKQNALVSNIFNQTSGMMQVMQRAGEQIQAMAEMIRVTNERMEEQGRRMAEMEKALRTLEKVSPTQAGNINRAIRDRARELCEEYRIPGEMAKALASEIRRAVKDITGARAARETARCDYETVIAFVIDWDDYDTIQRVKKGAKG